VSSQRCVRAGGKHNDLENVGYTARHHTFFEMLGNFSFGDYFKREAIRYAWDFLTQDMKLPAERLWVTIYKDDEEAADIWLKEMKADPQRFTRLGESSNFWQMGDTGPCGPCSEIFYDHGPAVAGGPPGSPDEDGDRYIEIWNLVFMQYNRDAGGTLHPLPKPSVDTGMGLERVAAVMQGVHSNYEIDIFRYLINAVADILGTKDRQNKSLNVIADHIRSCAFLIVDGVLPSNEGRGYVLRRIIRRAARHGHLLGAQEPFFWRLVTPLVKEMGDAYPELAKARTQIERVLRQEEERFAETLTKGMKILEDDIAQMRGKVIPGETVFKLYDTYGFPADLTNDIARERGLSLDMDGFERAMEGQRDQARAASGFKIAGVVSLDEMRIQPAEFTGYETTCGDARITAIRVGDTEAKEIKAGQEAVVYLERTPFYAESGGQAGDQGVLTAAGARFVVRDTQKGHAHIGKLESGTLKVGERVTCEVDATRRRSTAGNHSATHLLHAALKKVLGSHVQQKGSLVDADRLRFDFAHFEPITHMQLDEIERLVNEEIRANDPVGTRILPIQEAMASGAMALFGEKYGDEVRVVGMGDFSTELCGGTHVQRTGDIGLFKIVAEGGVAAGVRRIEAVTGAGALAYVRQTEDRLQLVAELVRGSRDDVARKVEQLQARVKGLEKELEQTRARLASGQGGDLSAQARDIKGVKVLAARIDGADSKTLRDTLDKLKDKLGNAAIVLAAVQDGKVLLIAGVTKDLTAKVPAGELVNQVALRVGGKGGGRPDMAQAGGTDPTQLDAALADVSDWVEGRL
ncbi:MAG TPA: alanine--tRNA ligase, partial [Acidiferrobacterales bacterium]|nr:alanine--tRNA ligase [Acidiferrobacterales bacterium]